MPAEGKTYIYALWCPVAGSVRYVGKADVPEERYRVHVEMIDRSQNYLGPPSPKQAWIEALRAQGLVPELEILEEVAANVHVWRAAEKRWIERMVSDGHPLTNSSVVRKGKSYADSFYARPRALGTEARGLFA